MKNSINYYVLFCQTIKTEKICQRLNEYNELQAFIPKMEKYIRVKEITVIQVMFPGYLFVKTKLGQQEFDSLLNSMNERKDGIIKELKKKEATALTNDEIELLNRLLDKDAILRISEGYKKNGKTIVTNGPLLLFQNDIIDSDKRDMIAVLDVKFLNRNIKAGLLFRQNK